MQGLVRALSALGGLAVAWCGLWLAYLGLYYYLLELQSPFAYVPVWKSAVIIALIAACILARSSPELN